MKPELTDDGRHITTIPFSGYYQSQHDALVEARVDNALEEQGLRSSAGEVSYAPIFKRHSEMYAEAFQQHLECEHDLKIDLQYVELISPREYNFSSDVIRVSMLADHVRMLQDLVTGTACLYKALIEAAKDRFSPRPGFAPFSWYTAYVSQWPTDWRMWDSNYLGTALITLAPDSQIHMFTGGGSRTDDLDEWIYEELVRQGVLK
jgi:hypothetical protein